MVPKSVDANLALVENNAAVGADIVREMRRLSSSSSGEERGPLFSFDTKSGSKGDHDESNRFGHA